MRERDGALARLGALQASLHEEKGQANEARELASQVCARNHSRPQPSHPITLGLTLTLTLTRPRPRHPTPTLGPPLAA
jgi:hypothetical protein